MSRLRGFQAVYDRHLKTTPRNHDYHLPSCSLYLQRAVFTLYTICLLSLRKEPIASIVLVFTNLTSQCIIRCEELLTEFYHRLLFIRVFASPLCRRVTASLRLIPSAPPFFQAFSKAIESEHIQQISRGQHQVQLYLGRVRSSISFIVMNLTRAEMGPKHRRYRLLRYAILCSKI